MIADAVGYSAAFGGGLVSFLSPCVLPLVPAYLSIVTGLEVANRGLGGLAPRPSAVVVLSRDTGANQEYGRNPYPGYDDVGSRPSRFDGDVDGRFTAKTRIVGVTDGTKAIAVLPRRCTGSRSVGP